MWRFKTITKFKNSFFPVLIYWNDNRIHLNTFKKSIFVSMVPPLIVERFNGVDLVREKLRITALLPSPSIQWDRIKLNIMTCNWYSEHDLILSIGGCNLVDWVFIESVTVLEPPKMDLAPLGEADCCTVSLWYLGGDTWWSYFQKTQDKATSDLATFISIGVQLTGHQLRRLAGQPELQ